MENKSLAERLAEEAMHLLEIDDAHIRERDALMLVIKTHEATIQNLQDATAQRASARSSSAPTGPVTASITPPSGVQK